MFSIYLEITVVCILEVEVLTVLHIMNFLTFSSFQDSFQENEKDSGNLYLFFIFLLEADLKIYFQFNGIRKLKFSKKI